MADTVVRGASELRRMLRERSHDLGSVDLAGFRHWLDLQRARWGRDPVFQQRVRIRELRRAHPELITLEKERRAAEAADAATEQSRRLGELEQELIDTGKAIAGLTSALEEAPTEKRASMQEKLGAFLARRQALEQEQAALVRSSPQRGHLVRTTAALEQLRASIELDREESRLEALLRQQGQRSGRSGTSFERRALELTRRYILPDLVDDNPGLRSLDTDPGAAERLAVLSGVTLGAAGVELDQLVVRRAVRSGEPVDVLAVGEVKRNINDLAYGFRQRQENLAWLTGDSASYEPERYRTARYRSGHFDREAIHEQDGERFVLAGSSFARFRRDPTSNYFLDRLYFITGSGPLWGVSAAALGRIRHRVATDVGWAPEEDAYLGELLSWCRTLMEPVETPAVLRMYAGTEERGRQILLASR